MTPEATPAVPTTTAMTPISTTRGLVVKSPGLAMTLGRDFWRLAGRFLLFFALHPVLPDLLRVGRRRRAYISAIALLGSLGLRKRQITPSKYA